MTEPPEPAETTLTDEPEPLKSSSPSFSRSLSSANYSPDGGHYDSLDDEWLMSSDLGELSLFDFLDSLAVVPLTLDKLNQRFKLQSREVRLPPKFKQQV
jgi:hypothetical protein